MSLQTQTKMSKQFTLAACNERLLLGHADAKIDQQGSRLYLRATLPHRDLPKRFKQYKLALGIPASAKGFEIAEARAWELASLKIQGKFDWKQWELKVRPKSDKPIGTLIEELRTHLQVGKPGKPNQETWEGHYMRVFKHLDSQGYLTDSALIKALTRTPASSRQRLYDIIAFRKLVSYVGLEFDFKPFRSSYSSKQRKERKLPTDQEIIDIINALPQTSVVTKQWDFVLKLIATYGLRPHEAFFCTVSPQHPYTCSVTEGKTGARDVQPLFLEWAE